MSAGPRLFFKLIIFVEVINEKFGKTKFKMDRKGLLGLLGPMFLSAKDHGIGRKLRFLLSDFVKVAGKTAKEVLYEEIMAAAVSTNEFCEGNSFLS